jgi:surface polysaccharide O-acyltransferase-like enzyme
MENHPEYFFEITYLRAFAILAVISIHVSGAFSEMSGFTFLTLLYMSLNAFSRFAVPLFVCMSGFLLYNKYQGSFSLTLFYKNRFLSVVPQFTIFSIIGILFSYFGFRYSGKIWNLSAADILYRFFTGNAMYHLWFFVLIIQLYLLYPIIEKVLTKSIENNKTHTLLFFLLVVQIICQIFPIQFLDGVVTMFSLYIFYFVLGMYVRLNYSDFKKRIITFKHSYIFLLALLFSTTLGIGSLNIDYLKNNLVPQFINLLFEVVKPFYYILVFILLLYLALKISEIIPNIMTKFLQKIGNYSFGIYLIHAFILYALIQVLFPRLGFDMNNWLFYPITFMLVLSLSLTFVFLISKFPYHEYIIGSLR